MAITTEIGDFVDSVFGAVNVINSEVAEREKKKADYDLAIMSNQLQYEAKRKFQEVQQNNQYDSWQSVFDGNMESIASQMEDSRSPYYCRNRYMAERMNLAIDNVRQEYKARLYQAAEVKQHDERIVKYNEAKSRNAENLTGQALIDANNSLARGLLEAGDIDPTQYQNETMQNFYVGTMTNITNNFSNDIIDTAIKGNMTFDETYEKYSKNLEDTKYYGYDGLEVAVDKKDVTEKAKKQCEQMFNTRVSTIQKQNYDGHSQRFTQIDSNLLNILSGKSTDFNTIINQCETGLRILEGQGGMQLAKGEQSSLADKYVRVLDTIKDIQKAQKSGSGSNSNLKSFETYVKNLPEEAMAAVERGDISDLYTAERAVGNYMINDWNENIYKESAGLTPEEKQEYYATHYESFGFNKILNNENLQKILKNNPRYAGIKTKLDMVEKDFKKDPTKYDPAALGILGELAIDIVASSGKDTDMNEQLDKFNSMANAVTLSTMNNMFKPQSNGFLGMFGESDEKFIDRTTKELEENDVVFTDTRGVEQWPAQAKEKIDAISNRQMEIMSGQLGKELSFYEYKKVKNDIEPIPLFKDSDGNIYHYETDKDSGKAVIKDQNGNTITANSKKDFKAQDKAAKKESRQNMKNTNAEYNNMVEARSDKELEAAANANTMPKGITDLKPEVWAGMTASERKANIENVIIALESGNKKTLQKYGVTKEQVKNMSREEKYNLVIGK